MKTRQLSVVLTAAALTALLMGGASTTVMAQATKPSTAKMPKHQEEMKEMKEMKGMKGMKGMEGMSGMMEGPHHVLAMAYRDNLVTFGRALQGHVSHSTTVDLDLARPASVEMRRSFEQMREHHQAQMKTMADHMNPSMSDKMQHMETHLTTLGEHLTMLDAELNATTPDSRKVSIHTAAILKQCAEMSPMSGKDKTHKMK